MARFSIEHGSFGSYPLITLRDTVSGAKAALTPFGATLLSYHVPHRGELLDITDGFQTPEELAAGKGGRAWVMLPFSNRIDEGRYTFGGKAHAIPMPDPSRRVAMHGFVKQTPFEAARLHADDFRAVAGFTTSVLRPGAFEGYPFAVDVRVVFTLYPDRLDVRMEGTNVGNCAAPFAGGWHPYFRTGEGGIDHLRIIIPASRRIVTADRLLPVAGDAAVATVESAPELDFRPHRTKNGNILGPRVLDGSYTDLTRDADGLARTLIEDDNNRLRISVYQDGGNMHVFTGDTLPARARGSFAMEPVMSMTNAFNREDCAKAIRLEAGATRIFHFGVQAQAF